MLEAKHSPLPWTTGGDGLQKVVRADDLTIVATRHRLPSKIHEANAELIVRSVNAMPELVKALEAARYYVEQVVQKDGGIDECDLDYRVDLERIDAALALAKVQS